MDRFHFSMLHTLHDHDSVCNQELQEQIMHEYLRQARISFNFAHFSSRLATVMTAGSTLILTLGVLLFLNGKVSEGSITTTSGLLAGTGCLQVAKDANRQMERANKRLEKCLDSLEED